MLLKLALLGDGGESAPSVTAAELKNLLHENGIQDGALETLLADYDNLRYAGLPSDPRAKRRWYRAAVKTARRYRKTAVLRCYGETAGSRYGNFRPYLPFGYHCLVGAQLPLSPLVA